MVVVAIAVIFLGWALTWDGESDILALGLACAAVIGGLAVFLWQAARERQLIEKERRRELEEERRGISPGAAAGSEPRDD